MALTKVTSGIRTLATGEVATANMATDPTNASNLSSGAVPVGQLTTIPGANVTGTIPLAALGNAPATDTSVIENNIAMLAFKVASGDSLSKFQMVDQVIDEFVDSAGIDTANSTNEVRESGYVHSSAAESLLDASSLSYIGNMTENGGLAAAFDKTIHTDWNNSARKDPSTNSYLGVDWGSGVTKTIIRYRVHIPTNYVIGGNGGFLRLQGSNDNSSFTKIHELDPMSGTGYNGTYIYDFDTHAGSWGNINTSTAYRYHRMYFQGDGNGGAVAELQLYASGEPADLTLISTTTTAEATPTTADLVFLLEDNVGSHTLETDINAYVSRNGNANWSSALTLVDEGDWGTNKRIITARNVNISGLTGTTAMRYKITSHNQSATKKARIHAVSLGWS